MHWGAEERFSAQGLIGQHVLYVFTAGTLPN